MIDLCTKRGSPRTKYLAKKTPTEVRQIGKSYVKIDHTDCRRSFVLKTGISFINVMDVNGRSGGIAPKQLRLGVI